MAHQAADANLGIPLQPPPAPPASAAELLERSRALGLEYYAPDASGIGEPAGVLLNEGERAAALERALRLAAALAAAAAARGCGVRGLLPQGLRKNAPILSRDGPFTLLIQGFNDTRPTEVEAALDAALPGGYEKTHRYVHAAAYAAAVMAEAQAAAAGGGAAGQGAGSGQA